MTPASTTSAPSAARPAARAASSIGPDRRVSRASTNGRSAPRTRAAARPSANASSGVSSTLARPRTPSVPKRSIRGARLALRVLRRLAGLLEAVLLAFLLPGVAGEQPRLLHLGSQVGVEGDLGGVDHHDEIARVDMRGVDRLVLAPQDAGDLTGQAAQDDALGVDEMPGAGDV